MYSEFFPVENGPYYPLGKEHIRGSSSLSAAWGRSRGSRRAI